MEFAPNEYLCFLKLSQLINPELIWPFLAEWTVKPEGRVPPVSSVNTNKKGRRENCVKVDS